MANDGSLAIDMVIWEVASQYKCRIAFAFFLAPAPRVCALQCARLNGAFRLCIVCFAMLLTCCFVESSRPKRQAKSTVEEGFWDCSVCTYRNSAEAFKCSICDVRKGTSTRYGAVSLGYLQKGDLFISIFLESCLTQTSLCLTCSWLEKDVL